jgi:hypothetical protein
VNPQLEVPYFCKPIRAKRAYDLPDADPEFAYGNRAAAASKFFIWARPPSPTTQSWVFESSAS